MSTTKDWLPSGRQEQLTMARTWISVLNENAPTTQGTPVKKREAWGVPVAAFTELGTLFGTAQAALTAAQQSETRTPAVNQRCRDAFDALCACMRDIKKRYFFVPPLTNEDIVTLELSVPDNTPTFSGPPTAQVSVETYLVGRHQLGVKIVYVAGSPDDPANKSFRVWYSVVASGEAAPASPGELRGSFSTKRKKDVIDFDFNDSGKQAYFAVQVENGSKKGPWGPLVSAFIP